MRVKDFYSLKIGMCIYHNGVSKVIHSLEEEDKKIKLIKSGVDDVFHWEDICKDCYRLLRDDFEE